MAATREAAEQLDRQDSLAPFRECFLPIEDGVIYLDGNSLGRLPLQAVDRLRHVMATEWGEGLVRGWHEWYSLPQRLGAKIAKLIGAQDDEVIVCDSTSVNFYKLVHAALSVSADRKGLVTDDLNFPSDVYLLQGLAASTHADLRVVRSPDGMTMPDSELAKAVGDDTALLTLSHTSFKSAFIYDMAKVTELAHKAGAMMLWDLSHSVGAMPLELNKCNVDLAVGCTYKYLNGGPGSPAFLYVRRDLQERLRSPIWGWFGQNRPFDFDLQYVPSQGMQRFMAGTPPILSMAAIESGVDMIIHAGLDSIRRKSTALTTYLIARWKEDLRDVGFTLKSPAEASIRGSHISLGHPEGWRINQALIEEMHVIPDFRQPDNIRLGLVPLYTTFAEVDEAVRRLRRVVEERLYERHSPKRAVVT